MNERYQFWSKPNLWPDDAYGFVFLARAIRRIGKATYADEWAGNELFTAPPIETPQDLIARGLAGGAYQRAYEDYLRELSALIASTDPSKLSWKVETFELLLPLQTARSSPISPDDRVGTRRVLSDEAVLYGRSLIPEENRKRIKAKDRWARVVGLVKDALRDGKLGYVTLPTHGGAFSSLRPKEWWNVPDIENRLTMCRMNPAAPYGSGFAGNGYEHIFVKEADLEALLPPPPKPTNSDAVKAIEDKASAIYDQIKAERNGHITRNLHQKACALEGISSGVSRRVYELKNAGKYDQ
ncbi:hypothetical protein FY152_04360 [Agrobacterium tumefaciens]|nr:hypothetical protein FY152_04360 [Agrobacterium tumefaciens]